MTNLVWLSDKTSSHTYGIQVLSKEKEFLETLVKIQIPQICTSHNCRYFIQGYDNNGEVHWGFVEFFGEGDMDKMLKVVEVVNKLFGNQIYSGEVLLEEPSTELLKELRLL